MPMIGKGPRRLFTTRVPDELANQIEAYAAARGLSVSEFLGDAAADAIGAPRPTNYLPKPRTKLISDDQEAMTFEKAS